MRSIIFRPKRSEKYTDRCLAQLNSVNKGGAGLGLIEMAKKTGNKLDYDFVPLDDEYAYFILSKTVNSVGVGIHSEDDERPFQGKDISQLERLMAENNIFFIWSAHISTDVEKRFLLSQKQNLMKKMLK